MPYMRGHWADRLGAIEEDIANMEKKRSLPNKGKGLSEASKVILFSKAETKGFSHIAQADFVKGKDILVKAVMPKGTKTAKLHYRHVNQGEKYNIVEMKAAEKEYSALIPGAFTKTEYPVMYFFEAIDGSGAGSFLPGINDVMDNQPYYVIREKQSRK